MAITTQAEHFLNSFYILERHDNELIRLRVERARRHNAENPEDKVEEIGYATDQQIGVADFVCLAFAVELYIKAVFEVIGRKQRGHNIRKLFEKLPEDAQTAIFNIHMKKYNYVTFDQYKENMDIISNGFEEFRYFYEHQSLSYHKRFALEMIEAMKSFIADERAKKRNSDP